MGEKFDNENSQSLPLPPLEGLDIRLPKWFPDMPKAMVDQFVLYHSELLKFNRTINLISPNTIKTADVVHFADCIMACKIIEPQLHGDAPLYDFGSGNGFPGLVFGILYPNISVILLERDTRKAEFLKHMRSLLKLDSVEVRAVDTDSLPQGLILNAMARGFAPLHKVMLSTRHQLATGGKFFHLKSDSWAQELAGVPSQLFTIWNPSLLNQYHLPDTGVAMAIVVTEKISEG